MAKVQTVRIMVAVGLDKLADIIDAVTTANGVATLQTGQPSDTERTDMADDEEPDTPADRAVRRTAIANGQRQTVQPQRRQSTRIAGKVIYTPAGTQRQITRLLDELRGVKTMRAFVLRDLAKHPGSSNREVRERIATDAKRNGLSVESVDNVIWQLVNKGLIEKQAAE
jgi:hypothetical protein